MKRRGFLRLLGACAIAAHMKLGNLIPLPEPVVEEPECTITVGNTFFFQAKDKLYVGDEIMRVVSVDVSTGEMVVERGRGYAGA